MRLEKKFEVDRPPEFASRIASLDETLLSLFADAKTEIVEREGNRRTTQTHYKALGREGVCSRIIRCMLSIPSSSNSLESSGTGPTSIS